MSEARLARAIAAIDAINGEDPNVLTIRGERRPKELGHAELVTEWVEKLVAAPSEALRLAARGHHIRRWTRPRSAVPAGRAAYLQWRSELGAMHAEVLAGVLAEVGYAADEIARVQDIVRKRGLRRDPEVQALEDALCLVFLETQLHELAARTDDDKMIDVLRKSIAKMSDAGKQAASTLDYEPGDLALLRRAMGEADDG